MRDFLRVRSRCAGVLLLWLSIFYLLLGVPSFAKAESAWTELREGRAVALIRHALAPGIGDPPGFRIRDCATQRNLSEEGRRQARRIGELLNRNGVRAASVYSSQWCRCLETARLLDIGTVKELPILNSFFQDSSTRDVQTKQLVEFIRSLPAEKPTVLVTHQVNITALTDIVPSSGEIVIFQLRPNDEGKILGRFQP